MASNKDGNYMIDVPSSTFPTTYVTDAEKSTKDFGLRIGHAIQYEWFKRDGGANSPFFNRWGIFNKRRLYARAQQSSQQYKDQISVNGDLSWINLDFTNVPILPKMVDIVVNGMADRAFKVKATGQDTASIEKREFFRKNMEKDMIARPLLEQIEDQFGVDVFSGDPNDVPQTAEEAQLRMSLDYEDGMELASEAAITTVFLDNYKDRLERQLLYDQVVDGVNCAKQSYYPGDRMRVERVDFANVVHSYTEDPNFKDVFYWGEVKTVHVNELYKINPSLTRKDVEDISKYAQNWYADYNGSSYYSQNIFQNETATVLFFDYKTTTKMVDKVKSNGRVIPKDDEWNPDPEMMKERGFSKEEFEYDVWYEGCIVLGTNILIDWKKCSDQARERGNAQRVYSRYAACAPRMYKGNIESQLNRMIPFADQIQLTHLKMQQVVQRVVPDGVFLDADGLVNIDLGNGSVYNPQEALNLFYQTGSVIGRSYTSDGEFNNAKVPIQEITHNSGHNKIRALLDTYNHYMTMLRDATGINQAVDASDMDPNSLVGIQKLAALNSNTATRHIKWAVMDVFRDLAEGISVRIAQTMEDYPEYKEELVMQIGRYNVELIQYMGNYHLHDFAIHIELEPDIEEKAILEQNISICLERETLDIEDAIDIRQIPNVKLANQYLKIKKKNKRDRDMREESLRKQMDAQIQMQSQQMAMQAAAQKTQLETQGKMQIAQAEAGFAIEKMHEEAGLKKQLMLLEAELAERRVQIESEALAGREKAKEDAKDKRIDRQSSQQSKLIEQREKKGAPINFESNEDSLDGFDLGEFDPR